MSDIQHGRGDSRSSEGEALPVLGTREGFAMVLYSQPEEAMQDWNALMRAFMKKYYSLGKTQRLRNKIATFAQYSTETISEAFERFNEYTRAIPHHKFPKEDLVQ
jgi:hypothetical protein